MKLSNDSEKSMLYRCMFIFKRQFSIGYRHIIRFCFHIYITLSGKNHIVATVKNPTLANYLYGIIGIAWICDKKNVSLEFVFPDERIPLFEYVHINKTSTNQTNATRKAFNIDSITSYLASTGRRVARKDMTADYGHEVISRLSIRKDLQRQADEWLDTYIKGDWVAVHYRGTDMYTHPRFAERLMSINSYIAYLKEVLDDQSSIFVCTDQAQFIEQVERAFPGRVYYRKIRRSTDTKTLHLRHDNSYNDDEAYQQKCDALIDVLVASKARLIYTTGSQFIDITRYLNPHIWIISLNKRWERRNAVNYLPIPQASFLKTLRN